MHKSEKDIKGAEMGENNDNQSTKVTEEQMSHGLNIDENMAGTQLLDDMMTDDETDSLKELGESRDKYLRLAAEFDNYRRRTLKEREELQQTAGKDIIQSILEVLDDSERAAGQIETAADLAAVKEGVMLVFNKLKNIMQQKGLKVMESNGAEFDPELHEAITEVPAPTEDMVGKVVDTIQPGYYLNDKLIRHAKVIVGK